MTHCHNTSLQYEQLGINFRMSQFVLRYILFTFRHRVNVFCCMYDTPLRRIIPCELIGVSTGYQSHSVTICLKLLLISSAYRFSIFHVVINQHIDTLRPRQNGRHFADDIFKCILLNENFLILNKISLKYVPWGPIDNMAALVQIMAWRRIGDKPLS